MFTQDDKCLTWCKNKIFSRYKAKDFSWEEDDTNEPKAIVFDIGHNTGDFTKTVFSVLNEKISVYAFEPNPYIESEYRNHENVKICSVALSENESEGTLFVPTKIKEEKSSSHLSSLFNRPIFNELDNTYVQEVKVKITNLDSFCSLNNVEHIDYLKIDTEGYELEVFKGAKELLKNKKITCGQFEIGSIFEEKGNYLVSDIINFLTQYGYSCYLGEMTSNNLLEHKSCIEVINRRSPDKWENIIFSYNK